MGTVGWYSKQVERDGFALLSGVLSAAEVDEMLGGLSAALGGADGAILTQQGSVYAARNVLELWPPARSAWRQPPLPETLTALLGPAFGLVRALFFDKPPEQTWALPWHKDTTIAVQDNRLPSAH